MFSVVPTLNPTSRQASQSVDGPHARRAEDVRDGEMVGTRHEHLAAYVGWPQGAARTGARARLTFLDLFVRLAVPLCPLRAVALVDQLQACSHSLGGALADDHL